MIRIGDFSDVHHDVANEADAQADLDYLVNTKAPDLMVYGGDQIAGNTGIPHSSRTELENFFVQTATQVSGALTDAHFVTGNHDIPRPWANRVWRQYVTQSQLETPKEVEVAPGIYCYFIDTGAFGMKQGGRMGGQNHGYTPQHELRWLRRKFQERDGDIKLVFGHYPILNGPDSNLKSYNPATTQSSWPHETGQFLSDGQAYEVTTNWVDWWRFLSPLATAPWLYVSHHDSHNSYEDIQNFEGVGKLFHVWQNHYYDTGNNFLTDFAYFDVDEDSGSVKFVSVETVNHTETVIKTVTPDWGNFSQVYPSFDEGGNSLEVYYTMDSVSSPVPDASGSGNDGAIVNNVTAYSSGIDGTAAYDFSDTDTEVEYVTHPQLASGLTFSQSEEWTIAFWFRVEGRANHVQTLWHPRAHFDKQIHIISDNSANPNELNWNTFDGSGSNFAYNVTPSVDTWHSVVISRDPAVPETRHYFDGVLQGTSDLPEGGAKSDENYLGAQPPAPDPSRQLHGQMDEFRVYGRALSDTEATRLHNLLR